MCVMCVIGYMNKQIKSVKKKQRQFLIAESKLREQVTSQYVSEDWGGFD